jgi:uncharacterized protein
MLFSRLAGIALFASALAAAEPAAVDIDDLKLKDFRPVSIYQIPQTTIRQAKYPVVDFHAHDYAKTDAEVDTWVKTMDEANIAKTIILASAIGEKFDAMALKYGRYPERFEVWCEFDYTGYDQPGWAERAVAELERCHQLGAKGVGELMDKGMGFRAKSSTATLSAVTDKVPGMHINDTRMKPLLEKCAELHMPINIHVAEDAWMYQPADAANDGLMNAGKWKVDLTRSGILDHDQLLTTLAEAVRDNPKTTFIACHLANCCADLNQLAKLLDAYPNLYADLGARFGEIAPIPRFVRAFLEKYSNRILYGTDMHFSLGLYPVTFRILESEDEHFYEYKKFHYHWPLYGLHLSDDALKNIYSGNGVLQRR